MGFYLFTRNLKNLLLKVLCYHYLTSELIPLSSSCSVTPCLHIGFTESASTAILCCSQPSYTYFNCRPFLVQWQFLGHSKKFPEPLQLQINLLFSTESSKASITGSQVTQKMHHANIKQNKTKHNTFPKYKTKLKKGFSYFCVWDTDRYT